MRNKKTIAIDLDDVLAVNVPAFIEFSNRRWGMNLTVEGYSENWMKTWDVNAEELVVRTEIMKKEFWHTLKHQEDSVPVLKRLASNFDLIITTSRRRDVSEPTREWIDKYFKGIFSDIHHAGIYDVDKRQIDLYEHATKATKAELCREVGADYLIDDHPKHCLGVHAVGIQAILFGNYSWNRGVNLPKGVVRLRDWHEIGRYFDALTG